jgi:DNA repair exonuclease SbcCD nuclease subunit
MTNNLKKLYHKLAFLTDTHFGAGNSNNLFLKHQENFFKELIPRLVAEGVTDVIHFGDVYDIRKHINFKTLRKTYDFFTNGFLNSGLTLHIIVGNHDSYNKNTLAINAPRELLGWTPFKIYDTPQEVMIGNTLFLFVPWICDSNKEEALHLLDTSAAEICCGHFDISGFYMLKNVVNQGGLSSSLFSKFKRTYSGHYHVPSESDKISYIGSPYELSWNDYDDPKRVIIYEPETDKEEFLYNQVTIHEKIFFSKSFSLQGKNYRDKILKIYVDKNQNSYEFDLFMTELGKQEPYSVAVIENIDFEKIDDSQSFVRKDTIEFLQEYINEQNYEEEDKFSLISLMSDLYQKAKEIKNA